MYEEPGFQLSIIYGRRRVGKSTLLRKFCEGKKTVYFTAIRSGFQQNMSLFGRKILDELAPEMKSLSFDHVDRIFDFLADRCRKERIIIVIDELPYISEVDKGFLSILQNYIDEKWMFGQMFLILCGSSVSFMEDEVLSEKSPLFGRRTGQLKLMPFGYLDSAKFVPGYSAEDKAIVYGVTGGIAKYLSLFNEKISLDENIIRLYFSKNGYMYEEPNNLLVQEYRNIPLYNAIIDAVSSGETRVNDISGKSHLEATVVSHALPRLITTGIIQREVPVTEEKNKKRVLYTVRDSSFRFWYQFVPDGMDLIEAGSGNLYYQQQVKPFLSEFMGNVFEEMSRQYLQILNIRGKLPFLVTKIGKWWGTNPGKKEQTDIDVVGINPRLKQSILGECKYKEKLFDKEAYDSLIERDGLLHGEYHTALYALFSKNGFSKWVIDKAKTSPLLLVTLEDMYQDFSDILWYNV